MLDKVISSTSILAVVIELSRKFAVGQNLPPPPPTQWAASVVPLGLPHATVSFLLEKSHAFMPVGIMRK